ncbi:MAG TPA: ATP-binding protein [Clostridia bacterium]|jgi:anti-sigma regulatory factor (Ser/Thr protein kinase)|nr:ATP-binding protein [Clostridia bacterium]
MSSLHLEYDVVGNNFATAGSASNEVKSILKKLGIDSQSIRKVAIAMYEGEINMVIHAGGGKAIIEIFEDRIEIVLEDSGGGIPDVELAMQAGYTTASETIRNLGFGAGMGLPNMKRFADKFDIESVVGEGTTIKMTVNFPE